MNPRATMSGDPSASTPSTDEDKDREEERLLKRQFFEPFVPNSYQRLGTEDFIVTTDPKLELPSIRVITVSLLETPDISFGLVPLGAFDITVFRSFM